MQTISSQLTNVLKNKDQIPIFLVRTWDTTATVPSLGISGYYYDNAAWLNVNGAGGTDRPYYAQNDQILSFDWKNGVPISLSKPTTSGIGSTYSVKWLGGFFASQAGQYHIKAESQEALQTTTAADVQLIFGGTPRTLDEPIALVAGTWNTIELRYRKTVSQTAGAITWFVKRPQDVEYRVLSSEMLMPNDSAGVAPAAFVTPTILSGLSDVTVDVSLEQSRGCTFKIPDITHNPQYTWSDTTQSFGVLKPNRLIEVSFGYKTTGTGNEELIKQFTGFIDHVEPNHTREGLGLTVNCRDFTSLMMNRMIENYPDNASYQLPINMDAGDKANKVRAYDKWLIRDALIDLAIKAGIDPSHFMTTVDTANTYRLQWRALAWPAKFALDSNSDKIDAPYLYEFQYGDKIWDKVVDLSDLIGNMVYFDENGDFIFRDQRDEYVIDQHQAHLLSSSWATRGTSVVKGGAHVDSHNLRENPKTSKGAYDEIRHDGYLEFAFEGVGGTLIYVQSPGYDPALKWEIRKGGDNPPILQSNGTIDAAEPSAYQQEKLLIDTLAFGKYILRVSLTDRTKAVGIEGFRVARRNIFTPSYTFNSTVDIESLGVTQDNNNIRNDILVVGQDPDVGTASLAGGAAPTQTIPPYGRATDLNSISNPSANNYIGYRSNFTLREGTISDKRHLQWLADSILNRFKRRHRISNFRTVGIPHLELLDPIGLVDAKIGLNTTSKNTTFTENSLDLFWVESISSTISQASYITNFSVSTYPPFQAWRNVCEAIPFIRRIKESGKFEQISVGEYSAEDLTSIFVDVRVTPDTVDLVLDVPLVEISFYLTKPVQGLYIEVWDEKGTTFIKDLPVGNFCVGQKTTFWRLDNKSGEMVGDGTYRIYIYAQALDALGRARPDSQTLWGGKRLENPPNNDWVVKISTTMTFELRRVLSAGNAQPRYCATDDLSNLYSTSFDNDFGITKTNSDFTLLASIGAFGAADGQLNTPQGIAIDSARYIYVADGGNNRIQKLTDTGTFVAKWAVTGGMQGLAISPDNYIYVVSGNSVKVFDSNGVALFNWGSTGSTDGLFDGPTGIAINRWGEIYVADESNNRIQKFDAFGGFLGKWGTTGTGNGQFTAPHGIAIDVLGYVYVLETGNASRIQKFTSGGYFVAKIGSYVENGGDQLFNSGQGLAVFGKNWVFAIDSAGFEYSKSSAQRFKNKFGIPTVVAKTSLPTHTELFGVL